MTINYVAYTGFSSGVVYSCSLGTYVFPAGDYWSSFQTTSGKAIYSVTPKYDDKHTYLPQKTLNKITVNSLDDYTSRIILEHPNVNNDIKFYYYINNPDNDPKYVVFKVGEYYKDVSIGYKGIVYFACFPEHSDFVFYF